MKILPWFAMSIKYISETLNGMISKHIKSVLVSSKSIRDQPWFNREVFWEIESHSKARDNCHMFDLRIRAWQIFQHSFSSFHSTNLEAKSPNFNNFLQLQPLKESIYAICSFLFEHKLEAKQSIRYLTLTLWPKYFEEYMLYSNLRCLLGLTLL